MDTVDTAVTAAERERSLKEHYPHESIEDLQARIRKRWDAERAKGKFPATEAMKALQQFLNEP